MRKKKIFLKTEFGSLNRKTIAKSCGVILPKLRRDKVSMQVFCKKGYPIVHSSKERRKRICVVVERRQRNENIENEGIVKTSEREGRKEGTPCKQRDRVNQ